MNSLHKIFLFSSSLIQSYKVTACVAVQKQQQQQLQDEQFPQEFNTITGESVVNLTHASVALLFCPKLVQ